MGTFIYSVAMLRQVFYETAESLKDRGRTLVSVNPLVSGKSTTGGFSRDSKLDSERDGIPTRIMKKPLMGIQDKISELASSLNLLAKKDDTELSLSWYYLPEPPEEERKPKLQEDEEDEPVLLREKKGRRPKLQEDEEDEPVLLREKKGRKPKLQEEDFEPTEGY